MKYTILLLLIMSLGCSKGMDYKHYLVWYESDANPLRVKQTIGEVEYTCTYMLENYFIARDIASGSKKEGAPDESEYYKLNIKIKNNEEPLAYHIKNKSESFERINYLVSQVKDDVSLISGSDTSYCQMHHYERVYHVGNTMSVMFIFDKTPKQAEEKKFVFYDRMFGNGLIAFSFKQEDINKVPKLKR